MINIIQSFWSKPAINNLKCGWAEEKYHYMSSLYSCLLLKQLGYNPIFYTDNFGFKLFIDKLKMPYDNVDLSLNKLEFDSNCWALGKVFVYSNQDQPFIHIDNDVFLYQKFDKEFCSKPLICQSFTQNYQVYEKILEEMKNTFSFKSSSLKINSTRNIRSINAGIIGGKNYSFFKEFKEEVFRFLNNNQKKITNLSSPKNINIVFEQFFFLNYALQQGINIFPFLNSVSNDSQEVLAFHLVPKIRKYLHIVGYAKTNLLACQQIEFRLAYDFPNEYSKLCKTLSISKIYQTQKYEEFKVKYEILKTKSPLYFYLEPNVQIKYIENNPHLIHNGKMFKLTGRDLLLELFATAKTIDNVMEEYGETDLEVKEYITDYIFDQFLYQDFINATL